MQAEPITQEEYEMLAARAWYSAHEGWGISEVVVMGLLECGDTKARRYRSVVIARLNKAYPKGRPRENGVGKVVVG